LRSDYSIPPSKKIDYIVKPVSAQAAEMLKADMESAVTLLRAGTIDIRHGFEPPKAMPSGLSKLGAIYMPVEGLVDVQAEIARLTKQKEKVVSELSRADAKLDNASFVSKAPPQVVAQFEQSRKELREQSEKYTRLIEALSG
jgi:valyl-tRNA synthetase